MEDFIVVLPKSRLYPHGFGGGLAVWRLVPVGGTELNCNSVHACHRRNLNGTAVPGVPGT